MQTGRPWHFPETILNATPDRYSRHLSGQASLQGRRLLEAGARFVTVQWECPDGYSWDSHIQN